MKLYFGTLQYILLVYPLQCHTWIPDKLLSEN